MIQKNEQSGLQWRGGPIQMARAVGLIEGVIQGLEQVGSELNVKGVIDVLIEIKDIISKQPTNLQVIWNLAIKTASNVCQNIINIYEDGGMGSEALTARRCSTEIMQYFDDPYHLKVLMGREPPENKGPI